MAGAGPRPWSAAWIDTVEQRIAWLREAVGRSDPALAGRLDLSADSFVPLWTWMRRHLTRRPPGSVVDLERMPLWYGDNWTPQWWDDESIRLLDGVVTYVGEAVRRAVPGATWRIYAAPPGEPVPDDFEGRPVVAVSATSEIYPWDYVNTMAGRVWSGTDSDEDLHRAFVRIAQAHGPVR